MGIEELEQFRKVRPRKNVQIELAQDDHGGWRLFLLKKQDIDIPAILVRTVENGFTTVFEVLVAEKVV